MLLLNYLKYRLEAGQMRSSKVIYKTGQIGPRVHVVSNIDKQLVKCQKLKEIFHNWKVVSLGINQLSLRLSQIGHFRVFEDIEQKGRTNRLLILQPYQPNLGEKTVVIN